MFRPIYGAAFDRGIAPAVLDSSPLHVVAWAIEGPIDVEVSGDAPETAHELMVAYREREAAEAAGRLDEWYQDDRTVVRT